MKTSLLLSLAAALILGGCAESKYAETSVGKFNGRGSIEWVSPDEFIYRPNPKDPLRFTRSNGQVIQPRKMYTDGGSIPRQLWIFKNYSPWGYGPAFLIHDWLFDAKHCGLPDAKGYDADIAADVMAECIKTLMEDKTKKVPKSAETLYLMNIAVKSKIAQNLWEDGKCTPPPEEDIKMLNFARSRYVQEFNLDAPPKK